MARRNYKVNDSKHYYDWIDRAGDDITCAKLLMQDDTCYNGASFHCQQCTEKSLKAYILLKSNMLVDGHNLPWLCKKAAQYDKDFFQWLPKCAALNRCYIETRYPADIPLELEFADVRDYYQMAKEIYLFICKELDEVTEKNNGHPDQQNA